jgi:hypothetical protein
MARTEMAVVVSQSQGEVDEMKQKGLDILPHRKRMVAENLDEKFEDPSDHLRLVFVCAMWITGFDVPECSKIYLDKPMRNHTLMQTIASANRVTEGKEAGDRRLRGHLPEPAKGTGHLCQTHQGRNPDPRQAKACGFPGSCHNEGAKKNKNLFQSKCDLTFMHVYECLWWA